MLLKDGIPYGFFLNAIKWKLLSIALLTLMVGYFDDFLFIYFDFDLSIPAFFGTAIVLTLAFRTNKAYNRWWEAKVAWESIKNSSRSWFRMILKLVGDRKGNLDEEKMLRDIFINRQIAWNYILAARLRKQDPLSGMEKFLSAKDIGYLSDQDNANIGILFLQSRDLMKTLEMGEIDIYYHVELEEILGDLETALGRAERIKTTEFPVLYDYIIELSIYIFCALLTYAIRDSFTIIEASFSILITSIFVMINEIARNMQDPFEDLPTDTPMQAISHYLERSAAQLRGQTEMPVALHEGKYFIK